MHEKKNQNKASPVKADLKDYTLDLPMFDLGEVIKLVTEIHEKGIETATMRVVAKTCGYASPSSTPFYRRVVAARLFKLLGAEGASLTAQAVDYLRPDTEDAKSQALRNSILGTAAYEEIIQAHQAKRLNQEIIANGFMRRVPISRAGAILCAKAFISSLKFAGFLDGDGTLKRLSSVPKEERDQTTPERDDAGGGGNNGDGSKDAQGRSYSLVLDEHRSIVVRAPLSIKQSELKRLQDWLALQLLVVPDETPNSGKSE